MKKVAGILLIILTLSFAFVGTSNAMIIIGSFETGDYTGWILFEDSGVPSYGTWGIASDGDVINSGDTTYDYFDNVGVTQTTEGAPITYNATEGSRVAYQLQNSSENHRMYQDFTLDASALSISWDMNYTNHSSLFGTFQNLTVSLYRHLYSSYTEVCRCFFIPLPIHTSPIISLCVLMTQPVFPIAFIR